MSDSERISAKKTLRMYLPFGYISKIHKSMGYKYSKSYIGQVLDPNNDRWNDAIISNASKLALKHKKQSEENIKIISELA